MGRKPRRFPPFTCAISGKRISATRQTVFVVIDAVRYPVSWAAYTSLVNSDIYKPINLGDASPEDACFIQDESHDSIGYFSAKELRALKVDWNKGFAKHFPQNPPWDEAQLT